jgi:hypothetical protein
MGILWNDAIRMDWDWNDDDETAGRGHVVGQRVAEVGALGGADEPPKGAPAPIPGCLSYFETIAHDVYLSPKTIAHLRRLAGVS